MRNSLLKVFLILSGVSMVACSQNTFSSSSPSANQLSSSSSSSSQSTSSSSGSYSGSSASSGSTFSTSSSALLPKSSCVNASSNGLDVRIETDKSMQFQSLRVVSLPASAKGSLEAFAIYDNGSGALSYELAYIDPQINGETADYFYDCKLSYSQVLSYGQTKGFSTLASMIPHLTFDLWVMPPEQSSSKLVGLALKNTTSSELAVQCF